MGHSSIRIKVRRRKVAHLAAYSRQFTVKNNTIPKSDKNYYTVPFNTPLDHMPKYDTKVGGKTFIIDKDGHYHLKDSSYENTRHKQPKRIIKCKKRKYTGGTNWVTNGVGGWMRAYDIKRHKRNDFMEFFPNYPYKMPKMNKVEHMEKLVQHKLAKWEKKNPKPASDDDLFKEEFVHPWILERNQAEERIRDFVVSVYDKLVLTGRYKISENKYREEKIAMVKDINGEGHHVNALPASSALIKRAQGLVDRAKARDKRLIAGNLRDHKKQKGRIILPQAA